MSAIKSFKPLFDRVLVQRLNKSELKTLGGIYLPEKVSNKVNEGVVIEVGTGRRTASGGFVQPFLKKGDRILLNDVFGEKINVDGIDCEVINENEILGFVENDPNYSGGGGGGSGGGGVGNGGVGGVNGSNNG
ncbi:chaperonin Cpn10 family protein [Heterostelium album PN500]|uniref:20 kDa chaperonin, chloroplastic n=1 Tax=Heterostelium pallidum (strain ATCC 26659 / Pp 5 / PN500) TaxID=670386 RepID=D3BPK0_HETP5|nr:chaperonin Cpn10 family protein [Heterostelium album PN500]EFA76718.1 chaperonin Cpn10 family protein [Heterostelium album PN500]|eukprot:XP_020428850.1 chaperonin Cpn10 family protein [Heterostelium album PN500]